MNRTIRLILTIGLGATLIIGIMGLMLSQFLQATFFSFDFFERSIVSSTYIEKVHAAIIEDLEGQSSYVGVPAEVLEAGLDDTRIYLLIVDHLENVNDFFLMQAEFQAVTYPVDLFYSPLETFIIDYAAANNTVVSAEQLTQLEAVAADSAEIVAQHINLFDVDLVFGSSLFLKALGILNRVAGWTTQSILLIILSLGGMLALYWRAWRTGLASAFVAIWLTGSLVLIPALVLSWFGLPRRLSLGTGYLKLAADNWLTNANNFLLATGATLFLVSTAYLLTHFFLSEKRRQRARKRH